MLSPFLKILELGFASSLVSNASHRNSFLHFLQWIVWDGGPVFGFSFFRLFELRRISLYQTFYPFRTNFEQRASLLTSDNPFYATFSNFTAQTSHFLRLKVHLSYFNCYKKLFGYLHHHFSQLFNFLSDQAWRCYPY